MGFASHRGHDGSHRDTMEWICFQNKEDMRADSLVTKFSHRGTMGVIVATMERAFVFIHFLLSFWHFLEFSSSSASNFISLGFCFVNGI
jgi:hypothetical protein